MASKTISGSFSSPRDKMSEIISFSFCASISRSLLLALYIHHRRRPEKAIEGIKIIIDTKIKENSNFHLVSPFIYSSFLLSQRRSTISSTETFAASRAIYPSNVTVVFILSFGTSATFIGSKNALVLANTFLNFPSSSCLGIHFTSFYLPFISGCIPHHCIMFWRVNFQEELLPPDSSCR